MVRRWFVSFGIVVLMIILQSTWLDYIAIRSVVPDLTLLVIVYIAFKSPGLQGQSVGFAAGLLQDGISAGPLGLNAFIKVAVAWLANLLSGKFYIDKLLMPALFGLVATIVKALYLMLLSGFFPGRILSYDLFGSVLWIEAGDNAVAAPVLFLLLGPPHRFIIPLETHQ